MPLACRAARAPLKARSLKVSHPSSERFATLMAQIVTCSCMVFNRPIAGRSGGKAARGHRAELPTTVAIVRSLPFIDVLDLKTWCRDQNLDRALEISGAMSSEVVMLTLIGNPITSISLQASTLSPDTMMCLGPVQCGEHSSWHLAPLRDRPNSERTTWSCRTFC